MSPDDPSGARRLRVSVSDGRGGPATVRGLAAWLADAAPRRVRGVVHVAVASDQRVRSLNRRYRGVDAVTDVLAFPAGGDPAGRRGEPRLLGDIVIARGRAGRQARALGRAFGHEVRVLALHGLLHLLGYDHERDRGQMEAVEKRLRRRGGLETGLLERGAP
jgi:probable rRNA maturation factor